MYSVLIAVGFLPVIMSSDQKALTDDNEAICQNVSASCNDFSSDFYKLLAATEGNIVCSPVGMHIMLSLLSYGSQNATLSELEKALHLDDVNAIQDEFKLLMSVLNEVKDVDLHLANAIYIQESFQILPEFLSTGIDVFRSSVSRTNFKDSVSAANIINAWIEEATKKKISNTVSSDDFDEFTKIVLVNAIYFKGKWLHQFETKFNEERPFHVTKTQTKNVPTMFKKLKYPHGDLPNARASFLEIPYLNNNFVMVIILPNDVDGLEFTEKNFVWTDVLKTPRRKNEIELFLPRFKIELTLNLEDTLRKMGLRRMFDDNADLGRLSDAPLKVSTVCQKVFIEVNNEGAEAAAATVAQIRLKRMIDVPEQFIVDHPFMFSILHKPSGLPLFLGSVRDIHTPSVKDEL